MDLGCLLLATLIRVGEVASGFRLDENGKAVLSQLLRLHDDIDGNIHFHRGADRYVEPEGKRAVFHCLKRLASRRRLFSIPALPEELANYGKLTLFLRIANN